VTPEQKAAQLEQYKLLGDQRTRLESVLEARINELKAMLVKEAELTGELPQEYREFMAPGEKMPVIKKRMGTAFSIAGKAYRNILSASGNLIRRG